MKTTLLRAPFFDVVRMRLVFAVFRFDTFTVHCVSQVFLEIAIDFDILDIIDVIVDETDEPRIVCMTPNFKTVKHHGLVPRTCCDVFDLVFVDPATSAFPLDENFCICIPDDLQFVMETCCADNRTAIETARATYEALTADQKAKVPETTVDTLVAAETTLAIVELPVGTAITAENETAIVAARTAYNALSDDQKAKVPQTTVDTLVAAETTLAIVELPASAETTREERDAVVAAREAYDALTPAQMEKVAAETLAKLEELGFLKCIITQNIDNLHQKAGNKKVLEDHGTIDTLVCTKCYKRYKTKDADLSVDLPKCSCGGILKPDFVFYGEGINPQIYQESLELVLQSDVMFVVGTSGEVMPACSLPMVAKQQNGAVIIEVNTLPSAYTNGISDYFFEQKAGDFFSEIAKRLD